MITLKDKIGYIRRDTIDGREKFKFIESKVKSIYMGKKGTRVYTERFIPLDLEELESNTKYIIKDGKPTSIMLVSEPFITTDEYSEHCRKTVDYWNEHGAKSLLDDLTKGGTE